MEKSYNDFMREISADELYYGLLAHGLFAEKLPPVFTSEPFFQYCQQKKKAFDGTAHRYVYYENMRNVNIPRPLAIPNPMAYQRQCEMLKTHWSLIQSHFSDKTCGRLYKASRIHIRKMYECPALFQMNYDNWRVDGTPETDLMFGKRYMVKADISTCFPSIYTHALSWALAGKDEAKRKKKDKTIWYNMVDSITRKTTHDETHGLLIGPHASNLLSEIILTAVDSKLNDWQYVRAIDDYTCYVESYEEGQRFLTQLGAALREYDLSLNHKKTAILELPLATTEHWLRRLNSMSIKTSYGKTDYLLTRAYLDYAIELMHKNGENAAIINYAIKTLLGNELTDNAKEYAAKTIMGLAVLYPYLITILDKYVFTMCCKECPTHSCLRCFAERIYLDGMSTRNFEQIAYALFFAMKYDFELPCFDVEEIINSHDCVALLMGFLYATKYNRNGDIRELKTYARSIKNDLETFDQYWLFLYEVLPKSDLKAEWVDLKGKGISFVKPIGKW